MPDVVISEFMDEATATEVLARFDILYSPALVDDRGELLDAVAHARALIVRDRTQVDAELLTHAPNLSAVGRLGVGLDNIDVDACRARDISVFPATGANDIAVAEYVITAALILVRGVWSATPPMLAGEWPRTALMGGELAGRRLGLIGFGSIARQVARRARALGMHVVASDPYVSADDKAWSLAENATAEDVAACSDVVSLHVPLTASTRHLVDADFLLRMRPNGVLINTARGGVVDESALIGALREGRLGGAAIDVFEHEPLDATRGAAFENVPNLLLTPHIAGVTAESNQRVSRLTAESIARHLRSLG